MFINKLKTCAGLVLTYTGISLLIETLPDRIHNALEDRVVNIISKEDKKNGK